jgi:hypothetical protein
VRQWVTHGDIDSAEAQEADADLRARVPRAFSPAPATGQAFGYLFPELQSRAECLLPEHPSTVARLVALGRTMRDPGPAAPDDPGNTSIPSAYTYLGQFVAHDITLEKRSATIERLMDPGLTPMTLSEVGSTLENLRTPTLELDNLYHDPALRDPPVTGHRMALGPVSPTGSDTPPRLRPPNKGDDNDVPRRPRHHDRAHDRVALIGDPRDDENLIIAQLQVAFLKAHNALVAEGRTFEQARTVLRRHYQHVVVHDFLLRIADPAIVDDIVRNGSELFDPPAGQLFMPLEFSVAAYRFGHSMISNSYDFNLNFNRHGGIPATLRLLFTFTTLSGDLGDFETLPENWIIEWENLVDAGRPFNRARRLDTKLVEFLFDMGTAPGAPGGADGGRLAVRDLLRGYLLRLPTGQAVAKALGVPVLEPRQLEASAASPAQAQALADGGFLDRTPLWYYVLAEAAAGGGQRLGPVGSRIVAAVLIGMVRRSADSIFDVADWRPTLPSAIPGTFHLRDLLAFAGVLPTLVTRPQPAG